MKFQCKKCGSDNIFIQPSGNNTGLYCGDCGKWIQWLNKDQKRLAERQIAQPEKPMSIDNFGVMCIQYGVMIVDIETGEYKPLEVIFKELEDSWRRMVI